MKKMQIIAIDRMREYLQQHLPEYEAPELLISTDVIPGCPKCNSHASVFYISLVEKEKREVYKNLEPIKEHKFPISIYITTPLLKGVPQKMIIGTEETTNGLKMKIKRIVY